MPTIIILSVVVFGVAIIVGLFAVLYIELITKL